MLLRGILSFILLMTTATQVHLETNLDSIIDYCQEKSEDFARTEEIYADTHTVALDEPILLEPPNEALQPKVYEKEKRQRPFECITEHTDRNSLAYLLTNPKYQELVSQCKSKQQQPFCDPFYPYRTLDGTCNNLMNPKYGSALTCLRRLVEPNYEGASCFRKSVCGKELPNPRDLSVKLHQDYDKPLQGASHMAIFFGQFIAHDMTDVPFTGINGKSIDCCSGCKRDMHPQCEPILISKNDSFYSQFDISCFNFQRTAMCDTCSVGKRNQINQQTSYLDLSSTYGQTEDVANALRAWDGTGKLKVQKRQGSLDLMPRLGTGGNRCPFVTETKNDFASGDRRVNVHTALLTLHTIFHREHNRIADELKVINPHWDEERLYQEARKINIAQEQSITYKEHLPAIVGPSMMSRYNLFLTPGQSRTLYNPLVDATMFAEFNTAAYRLHSAVNGIVSNYDFGDGETSLLLKDTFIYNTPLYSHKMSSLVQGICNTPSQEHERHITKHLNNYLFKRQSGNYGFDITAINIQRGKDNGLPTYTEVVNYLSKGTINIETFDDLKILMNEEDIGILRESYCNVKDIDLWVGANCEKVESEGIPGRTMQEIIALQFENLKFGDRFYFEHHGNFNDQQLDALKQATLSSLLCRNTRIESLQLNAQILPSDTNPVWMCDDIPKLNLTHWKEWL